MNSLNLIMKIFKVNLLLTTKQKIKIVNINQMVNKIIIDNHINQKNQGKLKII